MADRVGSPLFPQRARSGHHGSPVVGRERKPRHHRAVGDRKVVGPPRGCGPTTWSSGAERERHVADRATQPDRLTSCTVTEPSVHWWPCPQWATRRDRWPFRAGSSLLTATAAVT